MLAHRYAGRTPLPQVLAGSQICPPHINTRRCSSHPQLNSHTIHKCICRRTHAQFLESTGLQKHNTRTHTHTLTCSSLHLFSCVLFFPCSGFPRRVAGKRSPRGHTGGLIDSREFGGRGASKTALPLSLSSRPAARSVPTTGLLSFANDLNKN